MYVVPYILYSPISTETQRGRPSTKKAQTGRRDCRGERDQAAANARQTYQRDCQGERGLAAANERQTYRRDCRGERNQATANERQLTDETVEEIETRLQRMRDSLLTRLSRRERPGCSK